MVCINSPYAFRAITSQDGRQIHVGSVPHFFVCFDITSLYLGFPPCIVMFETC